MKKHFIAVPILVLSVALAFPVITAAASGNSPTSPYKNGACFGPSDCDAAGGYVCDTSTDTCVPSSSIAGQQSGLNQQGAPSGLNTSALEAYGSGLVFVVNAILLPVVVAIAFITFLWGVYKFFILGASNETEKGEGRRFVLWGLVGFVVIFSLWGLVNVVAGTFSLPLGGPAPPTPKL